MPGGGMPGGAPGGGMPGGGMPGGAPGGGMPGLGGGMPGGGMPGGAMPGKPGGGMPGLGGGIPGGIPMGGKPGGTAKGCRWGHGTASARDETERPTGAGQGGGSAARALRSTLSAVASSAGLTWVACVRVHWACAGACARVGVWACAHVCMHAHGMCTHCRAAACRAELRAVASRGGASPEAACPAADHLARVRCGSGGKGCVAIRTGVHRHAAAWHTRAAPHSEPAHSLCVECEAGVCAASACAMHAMRGALGVWGRCACGTYA